MANPCTSRSWRSRSSFLPSGRATHPWTFVPPLSLGWAFGLILLPLPVLLPLCSSPHNWTPACAPNMSSSHLFLFGKHPINPATLSSSSCSHLTRHTMPPLQYSWCPCSFCIPITITPSANRLTGHFAPSVLPSTPTPCHAQVKHTNLVCHSLFKPTWDQIPAFVRAGQVGHQVLAPTWSQMLSLSSLLLLKLLQPGTVG